MINSKKTLIKCACLIVIDESKKKILLVRTHNNKKFYLPGGKIEKGENLKSTLIREIKEELSIDIVPNSINYLTTYVGPAYMNEKINVELNCYKAKWIGQIKANSEVNEVQFIDLNSKELIAPTLMNLIKESKVINNYFDGIINKDKI